MGKGVAQKLTDEGDENDAGKTKSNLKPIGTTSGGKNASTSLTTTTDMDADGSDKEDVDAKTKDLAQKSCRLIKVRIKTKNNPRHYELSRRRTITHFNSEAFVLIWRYTF